MDVSAHRAPEAQGGAHADRPAALSARQGPAGGSSTALTLGPELARGKEPRLRLAVDVIYPAWLLLDCLKASADEQPDTRIELYETVLGGTDEALIAGAVDLAIGNAVPGGFLGDALMQKRFVCAAAPGHPLHALERAWPSMTCGHIVTWLCAVKACSGGVPSAGSTRNAGPYPTSHVDQRSMHGRGLCMVSRRDCPYSACGGPSRCLPRAEGAERHATLYLVVADAELAGPGTLRLAALLRERTRQRCEQYQA